MATATVVATLLAACASGSGSGQSRPAATTPPATTSTTVRTTTLTASLTGGAVVPAPGGAEASGEARVILDPDAGRLCWEVTVSGVGPPAAAHLHTAPLGAVGPVTVALTAVPGGPATGCADVPPELAASVAANPAGFYVDVHDDAFPGGAARGQLGR
ncbi:MAG TPA: CHRD domain-containing protein [Acidimicrobiales bacterium]|nr:CHRD domain-containing protein [Acidimicrobiales bacterium]